MILLMMVAYHNPVLLKDSVDGLNIIKNGTYVDATFGGGGHSAEILNRLGSKGKLIAFDQDKDALLNTIDNDRFLLINENFRHLKRFLRFYGHNKVDGILADFGVSSHQIDIPERGFSTRFDSKLDMRMDQDSELSAYNVINEYNEQTLKEIFWQYGELRQAPAIARVVTEQRINKPIETTNQLIQLLERFLKNKREYKILAQIFQAIRIEVNQEIQVIKEFLSQTTELIKEGGRLSVISYHSLEDRLVKRFIRNGLFEGEPERDMYGNFEVPFKRIGKLITPSEDEIKNNSRARSAKLRIAERI